MSTNFSPRLICSALVCLFMAAAQLPGLAWHGPGHMAVAAIAYSSMSPEKAKRIAEILRHHPDYQTLWKKERPANIPEEVYLFMRASIWPDEIRSRTHPDNEFNRPAWHYYSQYYKVPPTQEEPKPDTSEHIAEAMKINEAVFVKAAKTEEEWQNQARALCWIAHLVGDIQMPLHAVSLLSPQYPNGDQGGNGFWVQTREGTTQLHTFWDGLWDRDLATDEARSHPRLTEKDTDLMKVLPLAKSVSSRYGRAQLGELKEVTTFQANIEESFRLARANVYLYGLLPGAVGDGPNHNMPPQNAPKLPENYEADAKLLGERRLALGGYRLADEFSALIDRLQ